MAEIMLDKLASDQLKSVPWLYWIVYQGAEGESTHTVDQFVSKMKITFFFIRLVN